MSHFGEAVRDRGGCTAPVDRPDDGSSTAPVRSAQVRPVVHSLEGSALSVAVP